MEYQCSVCGLHYKEGELARRCYRWCSAHNSCNLGIARNSLEASRSRKRE